jgi:hypothetical protein
MIPGGAKRVGMLNVILQYKYLRKSLVHFVGSVVNWLSTMHGINSIKTEK